MAKPMATPSPAVALSPVPTCAELVGALGAEVAQYSRETFESAGQTARGLISARTLEDVVRLQTDFAQRSVSGFLERSTKLSELGCSLLGMSLVAWPARAKV
ncbi:MAG TPA: phasin family protein [Stellaceae bacterium]|jgi:hypothetical protein|nr:phasin family protein [Stellaceae bacterium]